MRPAVSLNLINQLVIIASLVFMPGLKRVIIYRPAQRLPRLLCRTDARRAYLRALLPCAVAALQFASAPRQSFAYRLVQLVRRHYALAHALDQLAFRTVQL